MLNYKEIFDYGLQYHHYANTAYPLTPTSLRYCRIGDEKRIPAFLAEEWDKVDELSLYVHIPFCEVRCKFCEYAVLEGDDAGEDELYVSLLLKEMDMYKEIIGNREIVGLDVGGGTPTRFSVEHLKIITEKLKSTFNIGTEVMFSIETTPVIAAREPDKIEALYEMGYRRISMGIQSVSKRLLNELGREGTTSIYEKAVKNIRAAGFERFNVDLMYGFLNQSDEDLENTLNYAIGLEPENITLYRNRYKGTKIEKEAPGVSLYKIIGQYRLAYKALIARGYSANEGKNTFSRVDGDYGTSDYLTQRVVYGVPYLGLGLGAQSLGKDYLSYNSGAASKKLKDYKEKIEAGRFPIQDIYALDKDEMISKVLSVAFYFGFIDFRAFQQRFGIDFLERFEGECQYLIDEGLMEIRDQAIYLTGRGADYINGVIPFFYSKRSQNELSELFKKKSEPADGEELFLKAYNFHDFERPSLTVDICLFQWEESGDISCPEDLKLILIKRGEHPYMNSWALPGGFVKPGETVEEAANRELEEETGIPVSNLLSLPAVSDPERDPRGWIVSHPFVTLMEKDASSLRFGEDAIDAGVFDISLTVTEEGIVNLILVKDDIRLTASVEIKKNETPLGINREFTLIESEGIAFDHGRMIAMALDKSGLI